MDAYSTLLSFNIKPSEQRIAVMNYLLTHRTHPTADEVYTNLNETMPTLSKTTVYNSLKLMSDKGAALMLTIDETKLCFDGDTSPHAHFLCKKCEKIYDLPITLAVKQVIEMSSDGHIIDEVHYYYKGTCKNCFSI